MKYEGYILSGKPVKDLYILSAVSLLLPISIYVTEGLHSGVLWAIFFSSGLPLALDIYLLRPIIFLIWSSVFTIISIIGLLTITHYWNSVSDWMDAKIPAWRDTFINAYCYLLHISTLLLGISGWHKYFRQRRIRKRPGYNLEG